MIHQYKLGGLNIVLDVASGAVHAVDEVAYDIIEIFENSNKEDVINAISAKYPHIPVKDIEECYLQVSSLKEDGQLFTEDTFEPMADTLKEKTSGVIKALCLHIAHTCNLNCSYCFASQGNYHGERGVMSFEVGKRALDFLVENSGTRRNLEVDFFGGEPLLNFQVVKQLVEYARSIEKKYNKNFRFTLTTNGVLIDDDVIDFANREMSNVVLSLDGRKEVHDRFRVDHNGKGSWDKIVPKFKKLVEKRGNRDYYMRGTFTHHNPDFLQDIKAMLDLGFTELSMEPVVCASGDPSELTEEDLPTVLIQYEQLAELMVKRREENKPFTFYHYMIDLTGGPCIYKRISGCGSGTEYMAVTPWGDLYPCHQFVGEEKFKLGDVFNGVSNKDIQNEFRSCNVYAR
ncbi:MAG: thioether cross-link-forming SCIFF peptide maturase, partial [Clostridia bacterium]|nr:thioether cross-link-forming SCIFF peptide maturase [Clostridia bacterium]